MEPIKLHKKSDVNMLAITLSEYLFGGSKRDNNTCIVNTKAIIEIGNPIINLTPTDVQILFASTKM